LDKGWVTLDASGVAVMLYGSLGNYAGVAIASPGNTVKGFQITAFLGGGIVLSGGAAHNQIGGDRHSGTGPTGEGNALWENGGHNDQLIVPNLLLDGLGVYDNLIAGNILGPPPVSTSLAPEDQSGPLEIMLQHGASWNRIGTGTPAGANMTGASAIGLFDAATAHNRIQGNFIGTGFEGTANLGGDPGVWLIGASYNMVGGSNPDQRNLLGGASGSSVLLGNLAHDNQVIGNTIGLDVTGAKVIGLGGDGVDLSGYNNVMADNIIAGAGWGVTLQAFDARFNQVIGNRIGFDASGKVVLGNKYAGVAAGLSQFNRIGGSRQQDCNLIAGAVYLDMDLGEIILCSYMGATVDGVSVGSQAGGISAGSGTGRFTIGGASAPEGNLILGSPGNGIVAGGKRHLVQGNVVGIDAQGSSSPNRGGISSGGDARDIVIQGNIIAGNSGLGGDAVFGSRSAFRRNSIYNNSGGGLALNCVDAAHCVAAPVLVKVGATNVSGTACPSCEVEVFSDAGSQGRYFEASGIANAQGAFSIMLSTPPRGANLTATATDPDGNTSPFSLIWQLSN
jgi:hypothetical protein